MIPRFPLQADHDGDMLHGAPVMMTKAELLRQKRLKLQVWYNLSMKEKNLFRHMRKVRKVVIKRTKK